MCFPHGRPQAATGTAADRPDTLEDEGCSDGEQVPVPLRGAHRLSFSAVADFEPAQWRRPHRSDLLRAFPERVDLLARIFCHNSARAPVRVLLRGWMGRPVE